MGDQLLNAVSERLKPCFRSVDTMARLSGDEFGVLLDDINDVSDAIRVADRVQEHTRVAIQVREPGGFHLGAHGCGLEHDAV